MNNRLLERDEAIINASRKIKALQHLHKFSRKIRDRNEAEELQKKLEFEMKLTLMYLDKNIVGLENLQYSANSQCNPAGL